MDQQIQSLLRCVRLMADLHEPPTSPSATGLGLLAVNGNSHPGNKAAATLKVICLLT